MMVKSRKMRWMSTTTLAAIGVAGVGKSLGYRILRASQSLDAWAEQRMFDYVRAEAQKREAPPSQDELLDTQHGSRT